MGILKDLGPVESFEEAMQQQAQLKKIITQQICNVYKTYSTFKERKSPDSSFKWGEEIEGHFLKLSAQGKIQLFKQPFTPEYQHFDFLFTPEYGSWMYQIVPKSPYQTFLNLEEVILQIRHRYKSVQYKSKIALTIPVIPFLGSEPKLQFKNQVTSSHYLDDDHITNHLRYQEMTKFVHKRRKSQPEVNCPIFYDVNTDLNQLSLSEKNPSFIHLDSMTFGFTCCCLQITTSAKDLDNARYIYDQLNILSPIVLALTAGTPFFKGKISNWDTRWKMISDACDDRTQFQRDAGHRDYIPTSRYCEATSFIWNNQVNKRQYNDFYTGVTKEDLENIQYTAMQMGVQIDEYFANYSASILKRDVGIVHQNFKEMTSEQTLLFQMLNSTIWNSVRLKIPIDEQNSWRVELRTMEVQLTPDQNAAFSLFIHLFTRVLRESYDLNLYLPITYLLKNFETARKNNAVLKEKFYFRTNIYNKGEPVIQELTIDQILFGKDQFKGLFQQIQRCYSQSIKTEVRARRIINQVKIFLKQRTTGKRLSLAQWMRKYVDTHPDYKHNSILSRKLTSDLLLKLYHISTGEDQEDNFAKIFQEDEVEMKEYQM